MTGMMLLKRVVLTAVLGAGAFASLAWGETDRRYEGPRQEQREHREVRENEWREQRRDDRRDRAREERREHEWRERHERNYEWR
jgi:Ni/Co efflux regulator RcnB